ncbi:MULTISPECIES: SEL1-like repeat protein [Acinetobacter]|jgi:TPR repeat protein|uniref:SEL1-like repeat protein n=2 Tax=Moraxellaceae TaxID=468 RepID=UPI00051AE486|nr:MULTISPECIES: SEL1-like repeat protein [Acinetobacter]MDH1859936.1 SEL1-like repeat protein [Acinetobacter junii]
MSFLSNLFSKNTREATALTTLNIAREYAAKKYNIPVDFIDDLMKLPLEQLNLALQNKLKNNQDIAVKPLSEQYAFLYSELYDQYLIKTGKKFDYFKQLTPAQIVEDREQGLNYLLGKNNFTKNKNMAEKLLIRVGLQGDVSAQEILGDLYYQGNILDKNLAKATEWYSLAADGYGSEKARKCLDWMSSRKETVFLEENAILKDLQS